MLSSSLQKALEQAKKHAEKLASLRPWDRYMEGEIWGISLEADEKPWICTFFDRPGGARGLMAFEGWAAWEHYEELYQNDPDGSLGDFPPYLLDGLVAIWNAKAPWPVFQDEGPAFLQLNWAKAAQHPNEKGLRSLGAILDALGRLPEEADEDRAGISIAYRPSTPFITLQKGKGPVTVHPVMRPQVSPEGFWQPVHKLLLRSRFATMYRKPGEVWIIEIFPFPKADTEGPEPHLHPVIGVILEANSGKLIRSFRMKPNADFGLQLEENLTHIWIDKQALPERMLANSYKALGWVAPICKETNLQLEYEGPSPLIAEIKDRLFFTLSI